MMTRFMQEALALAREAEAAGEIPVGCIIEKDGVIVGRGRNRRETDRTALGHAEIEAIAEACRKLGEWRLSGCRLFVTLEPCPMCAGAIINARISTVVFGAWDPRAGACGSVEDGVKRALSLKGQEDLLFIAGSLYLVGEVKEAIK
ncbi:MAG: hypothetical protein J6S59_06585, partial [Clostridia bacterium]|nr:hypothetical protein [Clostridia bacterium]